MPHPIGLGSAQACGLRDMLGGGVGPVVAAQRGQGRPDLLHRHGSAGLPFSRVTPARYRAPAGPVTAAAHTTPCTPEYLAAHDPQQCVTGSCRCRLHPASAGLLRRCLAIIRPLPWPPARAVRHRGGGRVGRTAKRHTTFDDDVLFDAHRLTGRCRPPHHLDLVAVGNVWCRPMAGQRTTTCSVRTQRRREMS